MGVWHIQCVRIDGEIMAAIKMQDDWTGNIALNVRKIHIDGHGNYYARVFGERVNVTEARDSLIEYEWRCKDALEWYDKTKF